MERVNLFFKKIHKASRLVLKIGYFTSLMLMIASSLMLIYTLFINDLVIFETALSTAKTSTVVLLECIIGAFVFDYVFK